MSEDGPIVEHIDAIKEKVLGIIRRNGPLSMKVILSALPEATTWVRFACYELLSESKLELLADLRFEVCAAAVSCDTVT